MFEEKRFELVKRQAHLVAVSGSLRERLATDGQALQRPFAVADKVRNGVGWFLSHPLWIAVLVAAPVLLRPRRALGLAARAWTGWRVWSSFRRLLKR
jgi:hypothetical protein